MKGALAGAIYDLNSGHVCALDHRAARVVEELEKGATPREIALQDHSVGLFTVLAVQSQLAHSRLGGWGKPRQHQGNGLLDLPRPHARLRFAWLELTRSCNLNCIHCYAESGPSPRMGDELSLDETQELLSELAETGCSAIQVTGGEPLLVSHVVDLIRFAKDAGLSDIEVFSNLTLLTERHAVAFKRSAVRVAASIYASNPALHDEITQTKGSFAKTVVGVRLLKSQGVPLRIAVIALPLNAGRVEETVDFVRHELGIANVTAGPVLLAGRGRDLPPALYDRHDRQTLGSACLAPLSKADFVVRLHGHSCWQGRICVSAVGDVYPCPFVRSRSIGNVRSQLLSAVLRSDQLLQAWGLSKDLIDTCRDCEFRYACFDCRARASSPLGKPRDCSYDPYTGTRIEGDVPTEVIPLAVGRESSPKGGDQQWLSSENG